MRRRICTSSSTPALIALGIVSAGMGLKGFLLSSNFIDGGVTGVSMLLAKTTRVPLSVLLPVVNLPFIAVGYRQMGARVRRAQRARHRRPGGVLATVPLSRRDAGPGR